MHLQLLAASLAVGAELVLLWLAMPLAWLLASLQQDGVTLSQGSKYTVCNKTPNPDPVLFSMCLGLKLASMLSCF